MKMFSRNAKSILVVVFLMCLMFSLGCSTASAEYNYLVHRSGYLDPGESIYGDVTLTKGTHIGIIAGAGSTTGSAPTSGNVELMVARRVMTVQCNGIVQSLYTPHGYSTAWEAGNWPYMYSNNTNVRIAYTLAIIEDR